MLFTLVYSSVSILIHLLSFVERQIATCISPSAVVWANCVAAWAWFWKLICQNTQFNARSPANYGWAWLEFTQDMKGGLHRFLSELDAGGKCTKTLGSFEKKGRKAYKTRLDPSMKPITPSLPQQCMHTQQRKKKAKKTFCLFVQTDKEMTCKRPPSSLPLFL